MKEYGRMWEKERVMTQKGLEKKKKQKQNEKKKIEQKWVRSNTQNETQKLKAIRKNEGEEKNDGA